MFERIFALAYLPLGLTLVATNVYWAIALVFYLSYLFWDDVSYYVVPEPLKRAAGSKKKGKEHELPVHLVILMAYVPLVFSLATHNLGMGLVKFD